MAQSEPTFLATHWEAIYRSTPEDELSWHQDEPELSLELIRKWAPPTARVVDVGGGSSPLAGRLVRAGYPGVTVLDISDSALARGRERAGGAAESIRWLRADVLRAESVGEFDVWHDRAMFHFLTDPRDRRTYVALAARTVPPGGHALVATFALDGPERCSGLPVQRHSAASLAEEFGDAFRLRDSVPETHRTPWGVEQSFTWGVLERL